MAAIVQLLPVWLLVATGLLAWTAFGVFWLFIFNQRLISNLDFVFSGEKMWIALPVIFMMFLLWPVAHYVLLAYANIFDYIRR